MNERLLHFASKLIEVYKTDKDVLWEGFSLKQSLNRGRIFFYPDCPVNRLTDYVYAGNRPSPKFFQYGTLAVWDLQKKHKKVKVPCIRNGCSGQCEIIGICRNPPRRIFGVNGVIYLFAPEYRCTEDTCRKEFSALNQLLLEKLPWHIVSSFPFVLTKKSGVHVDLVKLLVAGARIGMSPGKVYRVLRELYSRRVTEEEELYYSTVLALIEEPDIGNCVPQNVAMTQWVEIFNPGYQHIVTRSGVKKLFVPGSKYLAHHFNMQMERQRDFVVADMKRRDTAVGKFDCTFKVCKHFH